MGMLVSAQVIIIFLEAIAFLFLLHGLIVTGWREQWRELSAQEVGKIMHNNSYFAEY